MHGTENYQKRQFGYIQPDCMCWCDGFKYKNTAGKKKVLSRATLQEGYWESDLNTRESATQKESHSEEDKYET